MIGWLRVRKKEIFGLDNDPELLNDSAEGQKRPLAPIWRFG
ncbi:MAG: hypothetical protein Q7U52_06090 [Hydrogenophaga sp.]|nr:hypothetical protein [Hydrogenophaga sp.]MDO9147225.1 hypothetical protein [Hydrogenophaga sp.]MDP2163253.1 hypothetical protein [Hydrogenophaga sp.]MDP3476350.1 hypothetical protein [Hydrogenophaga sp.]